MAKLSILSRLLKSKKANVAVTFSLAAIPLMAATGMTIDYMASSRAQSKLQQAVDDAALAAGNTDIKNKKELKQMVKSYLTKNGAYDAVDKLVRVRVTKNNQKRLKVVAVGKRKNSFMGLLGKSRTRVTASSTVVRDFGNLEMVLVLDNTGSMNSGGKLSTLKSSARDLVRELFDNKGVDSVLKIGLVPFSQYVNVGLGNRNAPWLDVLDDSSSTSTTTQMIAPQIPGSEHNCGNRTSTTTNDGVTTTSTYYACDYNYGPPVATEVTDTNSQVWNGCVGSRDYPLNVQDIRPGVKVPGIMNVTCPRPFIGLSDVKSTIDHEIDSMVATGNTYIPAGLMWGWRLLSKIQPVVTAVPYRKMSTKAYNKAIVLMTDGQNTLLPTYPDHGGDGGDATTANKLTAELCANIKKSGSNEKERIKIYTIAYEVSDPVVKNLMQDCATNSSYYFDAANSTALAEAFADIARSLITLRIAR